MTNRQTYRHKRQMRMKLPPELRILPYWEKIFDAWQLYHTSKFFPIDTHVAVKGRLGVYRVTSDPYILCQHDYPRIDVESATERIGVAVSEVTRIEN